MGRPATGVAQWQEENIRGATILAGICADKRF